MSRFRAAVACALLAGAAAQPVSARRGAPPPSRAGSADPLPAVPQLVVPPIDVAALRAEDAARGRKERPMRFAQPIPVMATPATDGAWEALPDGSRLWRLRVHAPAATDVNLGFGRCALPEGATLHVASESDPAWYDGPHEAAACAAHGQLWTAVVPGDRVVVELRVPHGAGEPDLVLTQVGAGYRDFHGRFRDEVGPAPVVPLSGACNNDVVCPEGDPWRDEIDSVGVYTVGGWWACTGTMLADVPRTFRSWFLTADHCLAAGEAPSVVVYWNFQATTCGGPRNGSLSQSQSGASFRAASSGNGFGASTDFYLMELTDAPDPSWNVYYAGWDARDVEAQGTVGIHHPSTDEKAITFNEDPIRKANSCIGGAMDTHWWITEYEDGTTEGGSSGSALWDRDTHLVIGTLSGGDAFCTNPNGGDCYGRFGRQWAANTRTDRQLAAWLDPTGTGTLQLPGARPGQGCDLVEISVEEVRVRKGPGTTVVLTHGAAVTPCATGVQVRMASTARPAVLPGTWPADPAFADVTAQDVDAGPEFRHAPGAGSRYYLVVETDGTVPGPSGSY